MNKVFLLLLISCLEAYEYGYYVEEGSVCRKRTGETGACSHFLNCTSAILEVKQNGRPEICSFAGIYPIVCCKETLRYDEQDLPKNILGDKNNGYPYYLPFDENSVSLRKCREYHSISNQPYYDESSHLIKRYPHMAVLGYQVGRRIKWHCSASLISEQFVLTAAECINSKIFGKLRHVRLGDFNLGTSSDDGDVQDFTIKAVHVHPLFEMSLKYHNIALVKLHRPVKFNDNVKPACLAVTENFKAIIPEMVGWGLRSDGSSSNLHVDYLEYVSSDRCKHFYMMQHDFKEDAFEDLLICAGRSKFCNSIGGPLQILNFFYEFGSFPEIVGVTTSFHGCGEIPGIYSKLYLYVPWIESIVWPK